MFAISPSSPEEHAQYIAEHGLNMTVLSDLEFEYAENLGFIDYENTVLRRGYVGVNPKKEHIVIEVDYMVGENVQDVLATMKDM